MKKRTAKGKGSQGSQKGSLSYRQQPELTENEAQVLTFITKDFLTIAQIAIRRRTSKRAVYKIRSSLVKKGLLGVRTFTKGGVPRTPRTFSDVTTRLRFHAIQWRVEVLGGTAKELVLPDFMGCHVVVGKGFVELYSKESVFFEGVDEWACMALALSFFERVGLRLENDLGVVLIKPRSQNWRLVKGEWATEGSEVASRHIGDDIPLKVFATEDGHLWFWGDWSKKVPEHETRNKVDSEEVNRHLNDWRDFHPPTNGQLAGMLYHQMEGQALVVKLVEGLAVGLQAQVQTTSMMLEFMKAQVEALSPKKEEEAKDERELKRRIWYVG